MIPFEFPWFFLLLLLLSWTQETMLIGGVLFFIYDSFMLSAEPLFAAI